MIINNIRIQNFRGFRDKYFEFDPHVNVVLGDNTTGKTTLLHAVQIALGAFFKALKTLPRTANFSRSFKQTDVPMFKSEGNRSFVKYNNKPCINTQAKFYDYLYQYNDNTIIDNEHTNIEWWREFNTDYAKNAEQLFDVVSSIEGKRIETDRTRINAIFPLFLAFGSNRLERNSYLTPQKPKPYEFKLENAYKNALNDRIIDFNSAFNWIRKFQSRIKKGMDFQYNDIAFIHAIKNAIPAIKEIVVDDDFWAQIKMTKDKESHGEYYDTMSDGFKSMINIVSDIAYRCIMLNGFLGKDAVKETPGVVMIDEVDLFLHPHWQQHVLADLQTAFPKIQFIVTTHSPFIVQSVESKNVITLDGEKGDSDPNMRSIEDIAVTEMNMDSARFPKYNLMLEKAERYFELVKSGKENTNEAANVKKELDEIEEQFSSDPAYVALLRAERRSK